jgi:hypothetical protein
MISGFRLYGVALLCALLVGVSGCGAKQQFAPVSGVVKLDGAPVAGLVVEFLPDPDTGTHGPRSSGTTDAEGRFHLVCDNQQDGAVVGSHRVLIQDTRSFPPPRGREGKAAAIPPSRVPERYRKATDTPLRQEVKAEPQTITLEVSGK